MAKIMELPNGKFRVVPNHDPKKAPKGSRASKNPERFGGRDFYTKKEAQSELKNVHYRTVKAMVLRAQL